MTHNVDSYDLLGHPDRHGGPPGWQVEVSESFGPVCGAKTIGRKDSSRCSLQLTDIRRYYMLAKGLTQIKQLLLWTFTQIVLIIGSS